MLQMKNDKHDKHVLCLEKEIKKSKLSFLSCIWNLEYF